MPSTDEKAKTAATMENIAQSSTGSENRSSSPFSPSAISTHKRPPPPLLPIIETMLHMFYLEGQSVDEIGEYMRDQGVYHYEIFIHFVLGTEDDPYRSDHLPSTSAGLVANEAEATQLIHERMQMFQFIDALTKEGKGKKEIRRLCVGEGYKIDKDFLEDLVEHGKKIKHEDDDYEGGNCLGLLKGVHYRGGE